MTYSSALSMSRNHYAGKNQNVVSFNINTKRKLGPVSNTIILVVLACLLGLLYLTQVTKTNGFGYAINNLQQQQAQLQSENNNLELASAQLQSVNRVQNSAQAKTMTQVTPTATLQ